MSNALHFPRFFINPHGFRSDALIVRFDGPTDLKIITRAGKIRKPREPFDLKAALLMVEEGHAVEINQAVGGP